MDRNAIEKEVFELYPYYSEKLLTLEKALSIGQAWYLTNHRDLITKRDFRPGTLSRFLSCSMTIRFFLDRTVDYIKQENWDENFINNYTHPLMRHTKSLRHFVDINISIRFYLFHSFYHQLETTLRIVHSELNLPKGKPIGKVNDKLNCFTKEFIECIDALRNTIHNNGYYKPLKGQPKKILYSKSPVTLEFTENEKLTIGTDETLFLIREMIECTELMLKHELVVALPYTPDRN
jgi:hypothetical protein